MVSNILEYIVAEVGLIIDRLSSLAFMSLVLDFPFPRKNLFSSCSHNFLNNSTLPTNKYILPQLSTCSSPFHVFTDIHRKDIQGKKKIVHCSLLVLSIVSNLTQRIFGKYLSYISIANTNIFLHHWTKI